MTVYVSKDYTFYYAGTYILDWNIPSWLYMMGMYDATIGDITLMLVIEMTPIWPSHQLFINLPLFPTLIPNTDLLP